jgi:predicted Zn-dependent peptidase
MYKGAISLLLMLMPLVVSAQQLPRDPKLRMGQLENGLTYYIYPNQTPRGEAVYRLFVKAGSVNERDDQQGLAHFLEHLAFNGTRHFPGDGIVRFLESKGAKFGKDLNAHTSFGETVYKLQLPSTDPMMVDSTLTILADWAGGLTIAPEEVEKERGVILSEWLSRGGTQTDNSMKLVMELLNGSLYSKRITIGDTAVIRHASPQTIRDYYEQWYRPELMAVAVVGDIDVRRIETMIRKKFGTLKPMGPKRQMEPVVIPEYTQAVVTIAPDATLKKTELNMLMLLPQPKAVQTADDYRQYLMRSMLNSLMKLRFNALSFDDPAYAKGAIQYSRFLGTTGVTDASVELTKGKLRQGIRDFIAAQQQIFRYGFTQSEINRTKKSLLSSMRNKVSNKSSVRSASLMDEIYADYYDGNRLISRKDELSLMEQFLPAIDSVAMLNLIRQTFETRSQHYLLRGDDEVKEEFANENDLLLLINDSRQQPVERYWRNLNVPDALTTLRPANHIVSEKPIPEIGATDLRLDNGARVIFRRSETEHDRVTLSAFRKGGQYGLDSTRYYTSLVAPSIISLSGAGDFSREALNYYLAGNTATIRLLVDKLRTGLAGSAHLPDVETMFQLLWLRWTQPRLDTAISRMTLDKLKEGYRLKQPTPQDVFSRELGWLMNGRNYTNAVLTDSLIDRQVREDDMLPLHHRFFGSADGFTFVILGDCDLADVRSYISTYIGALPGGEADTTWQVSDRQIPHRDVAFVRSTSDQQKAMVSLVWQQDQAVGDLQVQEVYASALKSILRSALLKRLREDMGKVYSVSASVASGRYPSYLSRSTIAFVCQPDDADTLIGATRQELQQLYDHPEWYAGYLDDVKQNLIKEQALQTQQTTYWTSWIRNSVYNNQEDWTWLQRYDEVVQAMTMHDIADYARHILRDAYHIKAVLLPKPVLPAPPAVVEGTVFDDRNGNGIQDKGERGIKDIPVSNGDTIVVTDRQGRYQLPYVEGNSLLPILPANYTLPASRVVNAGFYYMGAGKAWNNSSANFALVRKPVARRFRLNAVGDVQVSNYQELDYATRSLWPDLLAPRSLCCDPVAASSPSLPEINLFLGDLVNNNLKLYGDLRSLMEQLPQQTWTVLGNHDRDVDTDRSRQIRSYGEVFGADMYAFNEGRVHFIVLNNVYADGARGYKGRLSGRQLQFVRQDLQFVPSDALIVLSMHIPLAHTRNRDQLLALLKGRGDVLAVTGHMHQVGRFFLQGDGVRVHELSAGASCGFWWVGERGVDGMPSALQQCGTPRNYFVLDFDDTRYTLRCKAVGQDERRQMTLHVTGIDTLDTHLRDMKDIEAGQLLMTVYGGCDSTTVRCRIDGGDWLVCQKSKLIDPNVARTREMNLLKAYPTPYNRMNPLRHRESHQLWSLRLPQPCLKGAHTVEVEASDPWGFHATGSRSFCFPAAEE